MWHWKHQAVTYKIMGGEVNMDGFTSNDKITGEILAPLHSKIHLWEVLQVIHTQ